MSPNMSLHISPHMSLRMSPRMVQQTAPHRSQHGIALLEAMIAIVILALGLLGTIGLQARSYSALADSAMRA